MTTKIYKKVAIIIKSAGNNHTIGLSITDATRHKFCSHDEAMTYAMHWVDRLLCDEA